MAKSKQTFQKTEKAKLKQKKREAKMEKRAERKSTSNKGKGFDSMIAYVDHNGHLSDTPPDVKDFVEMNVDDIQLGAHVEGAQTSTRNRNERTGRIMQYKDDKGYGFIKDSETKEQYFFHFSNALTEFKNGDVVNFTLAKGPKGTVAVAISRV
jgi:cold shock CspA family protein